MFDYTIEVLRAEIFRLAGIDENKQKELGQAIKILKESEGK